MITSFNFQPEDSIIYHAENLDMMKHIKEDYVDLIVTDPPFCTGKDFHAYTDRWTEGGYEDELSQIKEILPKLNNLLCCIKEVHSKNMFRFCVFMSIRLLYMKKILKKTGSIYLQCDSTANGYIRLLMDAVFGNNNYKNEIIWERMRGAKGTNKAMVQWPKNTDRIFFYTASNEYYWQPLYKKSEKTATEQYRFDDNDGKGKYAKSPLTNPVPGGYMYVWKEKYHPNERLGWRCPESTMKSLDEQNLLCYPKKEGGQIYKKRYLTDFKGVQVSDLWNDITIVQAKERVHYPTQKPMQLVARIIEASCPKDGIVFDPFMGSGTTIISAIQLQRKVIGIDKGSEAFYKTKERIRQINMQPSFVV